MCESLGYLITGIQLQKVEIGHLKLNTHVIMCQLCDKCRGHAENQSQLLIILL